MIFLTINLHLGGKWVVFCSGVAPATKALWGRVPPLAYKSRFLKWLKSGEKLFKEWVYPPYANEDQVQCVQLPMTELNLNKKINLVQNTLGGILKMIATSGFLTASECTKFVFGRGFAPDPAGEAYDAPHTP